MPPTLRWIFPYVVLAVGLSAVAWAVSFGTLPPADLTFANGDDIQTVDPSKASGQPEHRVLVALFEGLLRNMPVGEPDASGNTAMRPVPAVAESLPTISEDGRTYTFRIRPNAKWSNGRPLTADDFVWSWRRCLHPETASKYAYQLYYLQNAEAYNTGQVEEGQRVEIELPDRPDPLQPFPRGTIRHGVVEKIIKPAEPKAPVGDDPAAEEAYKNALGDWMNRWVYLIDVKRSDEGKDVDWDEPGRMQAYAKDNTGLRKNPLPREYSALPVQECLQVLVDFESEVGVRAEDERTLVVTLTNRTPYFNELLCFYTTYPTNRECIEEHGSPNWTKPDNIVSNGPYKLKFRRIRDRLRLVRNEHYWDAKAVHLDSIDVLAVQSHTTALSMYIKGQIDWATDVPKMMIPELQTRPDYISAPALITYFYRVNVTRPPLDNIKIRQALNMAIDKQQICDRVTKAGEQPARGLVPPGMRDYQGAECASYDLAAARKLLEEAGYPGGSGLPKIEILYNTDDNHRAIAEVIGQMWKNNLGVDVELKNVVWGNYLDKQKVLDYSVARAGWIGDYPDPNTFLDMFVTGGGQNQTGWSNAEYDSLIRKAATQSDAAERARTLHEAEAILMDELPIIPIYFYVRYNMVKTKVRGFSANLLDEHPLHILRIDD